MGKRSMKVQHADGRFYDQERVEDSDVAAIAAGLTAHRYGVPTSRIEEILRKITPEDRADLLYVCSRAAEKLGPDAFNRFEGSA